MDNYEKKLKELEIQTEGILGSLGRALRGVSMGLRGEPYTDSDVEVEKKGKKAQYSDAVRMSSPNYDPVGKAELYLLGDNPVENIDKSITSDLFLEYNQSESNIRGAITKVSNKEKVLKLNPQLEWLFKGVYEGIELGLTKFSFTSSGGIKDKVVTFEGIWQSGTFSGVMRGDSEISGGQIVDGYYISNAEGFKIDPWDFKSGGYSVSQGFVFGTYRLAKENTKYKRLSLIQVSKDQIIKIVDNNDKEFLLNVEKGIDFSSLDMQINGEIVSWENFNRNASTFEKSFINIGKPFIVPGIVEITNGVQSIEVKSKEYQGVSSTATSSPSSTSATNVNADKFNIKTKNPGWTPPSGHYLLDIDLNDNDLINEIEKFKNDINSGKFFKYIEMFKQLVEEGRIDGYGNYPNLAFLYIKNKGESYKTQDNKRDALMKYFSDFREYVIDNFKSDKVSKYYLTKLKKEIQETPVSSTKTKATTKTTRRAGPIKESHNNLSLLQILKKTINL